MRVDVVTIDVKPEYREKFIAETILNAEGLRHRARVHEVGSAG